MASDEFDSRSTLDGVSSSAPEVAAGSRIACLLIIYGAEMGRRIPLDVDAVEIGRAVDDGVVLEDDAASRRHACLLWGGAGYVVKDLGSTNGTYVNDVQISERVLRDGDRVTIGRTIFKYFQGGNIELAYHEEIYRLMTVDGLTHAHNKRAFDAALDREVSRAQRYKRPLTLVLFDIDHFKRVNDARGHVVGDAVLRQVAALVIEHVRREDIVGRVGGEEFALLTPEIDLESGVVVAEKLRALLERTPCRFEDQQIPVTASFGVASIRELTGGPSAVELYRAADEKLYKAKKTGRNCVVG